MTAGTKDLTITSLTGKMQFIELRCKDRILNPAVDEGKITYKDYNYRDKGVLLVKVLSEELNLEFKFGNIIQSAKNVIP